MTSIYLRYVVPRRRWYGTRIPDKCFLCIIRVIISEVKRKQSCDLIWTAVIIICIAYLRPSLQQHHFHMILRINDRDVSIKYLSWYKDLISRFRLPYRPS